MKLNDLKRWLSKVLKTDLEEGYHFERVQFVIWEEAQWNFPEMDHVGYRRGLEYKSTYGKYRISKGSRNIWSEHPRVSEIDSDIQEVSILKIRTSSTWRERTISGKSPINFLNGLIRLNSHAPFCGRFMGTGLSFFSSQITFLYIYTNFGIQRIRVSIIKVIKNDNPCLNLMIRN